MDDKSDDCQNYSVVYCVPIIVHSHEQT